MGRFIDTIARRWENAVNRAKVISGAKNLEKDSMGAGMMIKIIGIAIGLFVAAAIMPSALETMAGANLTGVDSGVVTIFQILLPILAVIGIALIFIRYSDSD